MKTIITGLTFLVATSFNMTFAAEGASSNNSSIVPTISNWINKNLNYPKTSIANKEEGTVYVAFSVSKNGNIENAEVVGGVSVELDKAALSTIKKVPASELGESMDEEETTYIVPIKFTIR